MGKTVIIDGHEYYEREDGLYQVDTPYEVTSDWMDTPEHINMALIVLVKESRSYANIVSVDSRGFDNINKVNSIAASMRLDGSIIEVMWAERSDREEYIIGGLSRAED